MFTKENWRSIDDAAVIPVNFLSEVIQDWIYDALGFLPKNAYISNSAGDYIFIIVVDNDKNLYALTDSYDLDAELKDKER